MKKLLTLCFVRKNDQVLLGLKKRGFGKGKWNGFGGKVEAGESLEGAARRELKEEACIEAGELEEVGKLVFEFEGEEEKLEVHVFLTNSYSGDPCETEEMRPEWFDIKELPFDQMWLDDPHWLPPVLSGKNVQGTFLFRDIEKLLKSTVEEW